MTVIVPRWMRHTGTVQRFQKLRTKHYLLSYSPPPPSSRPVSSAMPIAPHTRPFVGRIYIIYAQTKTDTKFVIIFIIIILYIIFLYSTAMYIHYSETLTAVPKLWRQHRYTYQTLNCSVLTENMSVNQWK